MQSGILILHILVCIFLIVLILLQSGREGMGVIFGGGGNSSVFGSQGAGGILVKLTTFLAVMFVVTSLGYNILTANKNNVSSVLDVQFEENAPSAPAPVQVEDAKEENAPLAGTIINKDAPKAEENTPAAAVPAAPAPDKENVQEEKAPADEKAPEKTGALSDTKNLVAYNVEKAISNEIKGNAKQQLRQHQKTTKMNNTGINPNTPKQQHKQPKRQKNTQPKQTQPSKMNYNEG